MCIKNKPLEREERQKYKYKIIRYYPRRETEEFINIGILFNEDILLLPKETVIKSHCPFMGDLDKFLGILQHIEDNRDSFTKKTHYWHNFDFTEDRFFVSSEKDKKVLIQELYDFYVKK